MASLQSIGSAIAGSIVNTRFKVSLPFDTVLVNAIATWELLDLDGFIHNAGTCGQIVSEQAPINPQEVNVFADSTIALPSSLAVNNYGSRYQIRYALNLQQQPTVYVFDQFQIVPETLVRYGPSSTLELATSGMQPTVFLTLPEPIDISTMACTVEIYNVQVTIAAINATPSVTGNGYTYSALLPAPNSLPAALVNIDPYIIKWTYNDQQNNQQIEIGRMWVLNSSILDVAKEVQAFINRAYTDGGIAPGTTFGTLDVIEYLRIGQDQFNASDKPTNFTFTNAQNAFRWFWVMYSSAAACRAQYLNEGMKTFNYSGQEVQLDIDRTQYWDTMATTLEQQANDQIKPFKDNLLRRGTLTGNGSSDILLAPRAVGSIGITIHGASPLRAGGFYGVPNQFGFFGMLGFMAW